MEETEDFIWQEHVRHRGHPLGLVRVEHHPDGAVEIHFNQHGSKVAIEEFRHGRIIRVVPKESRREDEA